MSELFLSKDIYEQTDWMGIIPSKKNQIFFYKIDNNKPFSIKNCAILTPESKHILDEISEYNPEIYKKIINRFQYTVQSGKPMNELTLNYIKMLKTKFKFELKETFTYIPYERKKIQ